MVRHPFVWVSNTTWNHSLSVILRHAAFAVLFGDIYGLPMASKRLVDTVMSYDTWFIMMHIYLLAVKVWQIWIFWMLFVWGAVQISRYIRKDDV